MKLHLNGALNIIVNFTNINRSATRPVLQAKINNRYGNISGKRGLVNLVI